MAAKTFEIKWLSEPQKKDYGASRTYLSLIYSEAAAKAFAKKLKRAPITDYAAKDIFRAAALSPHGLDEAAVEKDKRRVAEGQELSPLLLVRDSANGRLIIADGYHRLCAVYSFDADAVIPCKIV